MAASYDDTLCGFFARPTRVGYGHSYTVQETLSMSKVQTYLYLAQARGDTLVDYTKPDWYYCIVEDGSIFKCNPRDHSFYGLDLERFVWVWDRRFLSIFYDTFLKYQEIGGFRDYFLHDTPTGNDNHSGCDSQSPARTTLQVSVDKCQPMFDGIHDFAQRNERVPGQSYYECKRCGFIVSSHELDMLRVDIGYTPTVTIWPCRAKRYTYCTCGRLAGNGVNGTCVYSEEAAICSMCGQRFTGHHNCEDDLLTRKLLKDLGESD